MYALMMQGLKVSTASMNATSSNAATATSPNAAKPSRWPDSPARARLSGSPGSSWSRQTTADAADESVRTFSRQTTEEWHAHHGGHLSRQVTEESRRLPLSQLLSLPEPEVLSETEAKSDDEELQVRLKNTFLHWEAVPSPTSSMRRSRSLPTALPEAPLSTSEIANQAEIDTDQPAGN